MRFLLAAENAELRRRLRQLLLNCAHECGAEDSVDLADASVRLSQARPDVVLVVLGPAPESALATIQRIADEVGVPVLAVGPADSPELIKQALRAGALEYLDQQDLRGELDAALAKLARMGRLHEGRSGGRVLAVTAAQAGCGVTTVASNLAFVLAETYPGKVALVELGVDVPELAIDLDLEPRHPLDELLQHWDRMDARVVQDAFSEHPAGVKVLAYRPETLTAPAVGPEAVRQTVMLLRATCEVSVLDLGHGASPAALEAMRAADSVIVVVRLDVPSLRLSREYLRLLEREGVRPDKLQPVANRYGQRGTIPWKKAEESLTVPFRGHIVDDPASINKAVNNGRPLTQQARFARITRRFRDLARQVNGRI